MSRLSFINIMHHVNGVGNVRHPCIRTQKAVCSPCCVMARLMALWSSLCRLLLKLQLQMVTDGKLLGWKTVSASFIHYAGFKVLFLLNLRFHRSIPPFQSVHRSSPVIVDYPHFLQVLSQLYFLYFRLAALFNLIPRIIVGQSWTID